MRIIKGENEDDVYRAICNEMINIESSVEQYDAAGPLETPKSTMGYPSYITASGPVTIRGANGYIFVPQTIEIQEFISTLVTKINKYPTCHLHKYHSVCTPGIHSAQKVRCSTALTSSKRGGKNIIRLITSAYSDGQENSLEGIRFCWFVDYIQYFRFEITQNTIRMDLEHHALSIFYDESNLTDLPNWTYVPTFRKSMFKNSSLMIDESIRISKFLPAAFEISTFWQTYKALDEQILYRNIKRNIYRQSYNNIKICNNKIGDDYTCLTCNTILYDDNYMLYQNNNTNQNNTNQNNNSSSDIGVAICPLCMHTHRVEIEKQYAWLFIVKFPKTIMQMIQSLTCSAEKKDILIESTKSVRWEEIKHDKKADIAYVLIGDKYVGLANVDIFLMEPTEDMKGRQAFRLI